jgi:hypothetical protein
MLWLGLAVLVVAIAALTGLKARGTRPVAGTRLMGVGRFVLLLVALVFLYLAFRGRT